MSGVGQVRTGDSMTRARAHRHGSVTSVAPTSPTTGVLRESSYNAPAPLNCRRLRWPGKGRHRLTPRGEDRPLVLPEEVSLAVVMHQDPVRADYCNRVVSEKVQSAEEGRCAGGLDDVPQRASSCVRTTHTKRDCDQRMACGRAACLADLRRRRRRRGQPIQAGRDG